MARGVHTPFAGQTFGSCFQLQKGGTGEKDITEEVPLPQTPLLTLAQETWAKIYSGIESLQRATSESFRPICGEEEDLLSQQCTGEPSQVPHVAEVAGPIATVFILHLPGERKSGAQP